MEWAGVGCGELVLSHASTVEDVTAIVPWLMGAVAFHCDAQSVGLLEVRYDAGH